MLRRVTMQISCTCGISLSHASCSKSHLSSPALQMSRVASPALRDEKNDPSCAKRSLLMQQCYHSCVKVGTMICFGLVLESDMHADHQAHGCQRT